MAIVRKKGVVLVLEAHRRGGEMTVDGEVVVLSFSEVFSLGSSFGSSVVGMVLLRR